MAYNRRTTVAACGPWRTSVPSKQESAFPNLLYRLQARGSHSPDRRCTAAGAQTSWCQELTGTSRRAGPCWGWVLRQRWQSGAAGACVGPPRPGKWCQTWPSTSLAPSPCSGHQFRAGYVHASRCASWKPRASRWPSSHHSAPYDTRGRSSETPVKAEE